MVVGFTITYVISALSPLTLWVRIPLRRSVLYTALCDKVCQWLVQVGGFLRFPPPIKLICTINALLLKVALNTTTLPPITLYLIIGKQLSDLSETENNLFILFAGHFFSKQSTFKWIPTVLLLSLTCSFIRISQTSYHEKPTEVNPIL